MDASITALESAREILNYVRVVDRQPHPMPTPETASVAVIGLGYVGLPLAIGFAENAQSIGFDICDNKLAELRRGIDHTGEINKNDLVQPDILFTSNCADLSKADVIIVCVPTPVNRHNKPDYSPLLAASKTIGQHMKKGTVVIFESTVDPGTTQDRCQPIIEKFSGYKEGVDFYLGYSPERINPGDPTRKLSDIKKIVAGSSESVTIFMENLYARVVGAGLHRATSIRVAEAAKILENTQRDVNIALMNQMMMLFDKMGIRSSEVIEAASSKWNFHRYRPGLVGGHCIAVDPYFLVDAGRRHGLAMELVSAAREVNEQTPYFLVEKLEELFESQQSSLKGKRVLVLGRSFKEDCADTRNSKAFKMMDAIWAAGADVDCFDPVADDGNFEGGRGTKIIDNPFAHEPYDAVIITLRHSVFMKNFDTESIKRLAKKHGPMIDLRGSYENEMTIEHFTYWRP